MNFENETQKAVYQALIANQNLLCLVNGVYDFIEQNLEYPYITIGESSDLEWDTFYDVGRTTLFSVHVWSNDRGTKKAQEILSEVYSSLTRVKLTTEENFNFVTCQYESGDMFRDDGGLIWHGVHQYRIIVEETNNGS